MELKTQPFHCRLPVRTRLDSQALHKDFPARLYSPAPPPECALSPAPPKMPRVVPDAETLLPIGTEELKKPPL
jgi:hypothetical protein